MVYLFLNFLDILIIYAALDVDWTFDVNVGWRVGLLLIGCPDSRNAGSQPSTT